MSPRCRSSISSLLFRAAGMGLTIAALLLLGTVQQMDSFLALSLLGVIVLGSSRIFQRIR